MESLPKNLIPFIWHFIKRQWLWFLLAQFLFFAWSIDHTLWPYILKLLVDQLVLIDQDRAIMWTVIAGTVIKGALLWIYVEASFRLAGFVSVYCMPRLEADVRMGMFNYVQHHSYGYFSNHFAGSIANKIADMPQGVSQVIDRMIRIFMPVSLAVIVVTIMFYQVQPLFALILAGWVAIHLSICLITAKRSIYYSDVHGEARSSLAGKIVDSLTNHLNVKLFSRRPFESSLMAQSQKEELKTNQKAVLYIEKTRVALGITCFLIVGVVLNWCMLAEWQKGNLTTGDVILIFNATWNVTMLMWITGMELPLFFKDVGICRQALSIIQDTHDIVDTPNAKPLVVTKGEIVFDRATFRYNKDRIIFNEKSIIIAPREKVGLVGFSGSGKSTFVNLILRHFDIENGRILIDGQDISKVMQDSLRDNIAMIPQDAFLFHRSLMENIRYGKPDATDDEVIEAAKKSHSHEFISQLTDGYQTIVGERGLKLSGGQRQRIAIARAILKNAPILILDEATSALDTVTEKYIQANLNELMNGRTSIIIAHRLSTLADMDRILVFKDGKIIEDGTHDQLLQKQGHYASMWQMQAGGFLPEKGE